jgi:hypothetical protein
MWNWMMRWPGRQCINFSMASTRKFFYLVFVPIGTQGGMRDSLV